MILTIIPLQAFAEKETSQNIRNEKENIVNGSSVRENTGDKGIAANAAPELRATSGTGVAIDEEHFPNQKFRDHVKEYDKDKNGILSQEELDAVTEINCINKGIRDFTGIEHFKKLKVFYCNSNSLITLDVSKNTALEHLYCLGNQLSALDLSKNLALKELNCGYNKLSILDVSKNTALEHLYCLGNQLSTLDLSKNLALKHLDCKKNKLNTLEVRNNTALVELHCSENKLSALDLSKNLALVELNCDENQLSTLDVSKNLALKKLWCNKNHLTSLDLSKNEKIKNFNGNDEKYTIEVDKKDLSFDLASLPGNFNPALTSDWERATISDSTLKLNSSKPSFVKYRYKVNDYEDLRVTLNIDYVDKFAVSFDSGDGSGNMEPVKVTKNSNYKLPQCTFTAPAGKEFSAWEVNSVEKKVGEEINVKEDITVKALWKDKQAVTPADPEIVGPVNPLDPNVKISNVNNYWKVIFKSEDATKGKVAEEDTVYVLKIANKTLADLVSKAPATTANAGFEFENWTPALDASTKIDKDITVKANFKKAGTTPVTPADPEIVGPVNPLDPNVKISNVNNYWKVIFKSEDATKGKVAEEDTVYVLKTANKTLADITAPATTPAKGYEFEKWTPALEASTKINNNLTVNANFKAKDIVKVGADPKTQVPEGYTRVTFDATENGTIEGTNRYKVLDILTGTTW
ncbi:leucine-rich repeat domain-containing protein, partial [Peptoniphilus sp. SGI.035]|uniref:leucine-rich repeat domain-containing protein n=1 Tax=Peptoniphilus sp. SGI.035 TaxID=3420564 RepID=UPI003CFC6CF4